MLALWLPSFILPFLKSYRAWYFPLNWAWSYLWLTAFIFARQDYRRGNCFFNSPFGGSCSLKRSLSAFIFLAFFFTLVAAVVDLVNIKYPEEDTHHHIEKEVRHSDVTGTTTA